MSAKASIVARPQRLHAHVDRFAHSAFVWGEFDCCTWAADWVQSERGADPMASLREFKSALQAARGIRQEGGLRHAIGQRLGAEIAPLLAQVGDVVLVPTPRGVNRFERGLQGDALGFSAGVCMGDHVAVPALVGLAMLPLALRLAGQDAFESCGVAAWRV